MALTRTQPGSLKLAATRRPRERWARAPIVALFLAIAALCCTTSLPAQLGGGGGRPGNGVSSNRPRNLSLRLLARGRVRLTWLSPRRLSYQRILRADGDGNFRVIENRLPGDLQVYVDPLP